MNGSKYSSSLETFPWGMSQIGQRSVLLQFWRNERFSRMTWRGHCSPETVSRVTSRTVAALLSGWETVSGMRVARTQRLWRASHEKNSPTIYTNAIPTLLNQARKPECINDWQLLVTLANESSIAHFFNGFDFNRSYYLVVVFIASPRTNCFIRSRSARNVGNRVSGLDSHWYRPW